MMSRKELLKKAIDASEAMLKANELADQALSKSKEASMAFVRAESDAIDAAKSADLACANLFLSWGLHERPTAIECDGLLYVSERQDGSCWHYLKKLQIQKT